MIIINTNSPPSLQTHTLFTHKVYITSQIPSKEVKKGDPETAHIYNRKESQKKKNEAPLNLQEQRNKASSDAMAIMQAAQDCVFSKGG